MLVPAKTNVTSIANADTIDLDVNQRRKGWSAYIITGTDLLLPYSANSANISINFTGAEQARRDAPHMCLAQHGSAS